MLKKKLLLFVAGLAMVMVLPVSAKANTSVDVHSTNPGHIQDEYTKYDKDNLFTDNDKAVVNKNDLDNIKGELQKIESKLSAEDKKEADAIINAIVSGHNAGNQDDGIYKHGLDLLRKYAKEEKTNALNTDSNSDSSHIEKQKEENLLSKVDDKKSEKEEVKADDKKKVKEEVKSDDKKNVKEEVKSDDKNTQKEEIKTSDKKSSQKEIKVKDKKDLKKKSTNVDKKSSKSSTSDAIKELSKDLKPISQKATKGDLIAISQKRVKLLKSLLDKKEIKLNKRLSKQMAVVLKKNSMLNSKSSLSALKKCDRDTVRLIKQIVKMQKMS